ncbi:sulfatase-like hydrolase/transferase [Methanococcoides methylutens]|uniref:sulfatase-like hydrolase/transferase n=1 Tax=Methanococcoides methylutens TaxID=2226 RepID=UPI0009E40737|nr:sulfatase-like hydrolase/transferase [Methanococcoides methylutens]
MKNGPTSINILVRTLIFLFICNIIFLTAPPASALTHIDVNPTNTPDGAVILIIDGLGSSYVYPEMTPYAIDGTITEKPLVNNINIASDNGLRALNMLTPSSEGETGHLVIASGNSGATPAMISQPDATIYDIANRNNYLTIGILQKGDIPELLAEQDIVVHDITTSINDPQMEVLTYFPYLSEYENLQTSLTEMMETNAELAPSYVAQYKEGSIERYYAYNRWAMDTAIEVLDLMHESYPEQNFILTVNVGAVDTAGLYRRNEGYADTIEDLDIMIGELYEVVEKNDLALIITSDHGMAFQSADGRGGSKSYKYASQPEVFRIPFVVTSKNLKSEILEGEFSQQDIAPTILSVLDIPDEMRFSNGRSLASKDYVNFKVILPEAGTVTIYRANETISRASGDDSYIFYGLNRNEHYNIVVETAGETGTIMERNVFSDTDQIIRFSPSPDISKPSESPEKKDTLRIFGSVLIVMINLAGLGIIFRIIKK